MNGTIERGPGSLRSDDDRAVPARGAVAIHRSEIQFRRLLEALPAGAYTCDPDGLITYFNRHAEGLWGRAPRLYDPVDRFCGSFKLYAADGAPIAHDQCWMALALRDERAYNGHEIIVERPDGGRLTVLAHANPIRDEAGRLLGAVNVLVDISGRKQAETALREADRCRNEFLATLAHELRNPLAPMRTALKTLQMQGDATVRPAVEIVERQIGQMTRLIDDLLDVARITSNRLELRIEPVLLAQIVEAALETSRPLIDAKGQVLDVTLPPAPAVFEVDATRVAQVIANLLKNAAKYTPAGGRIGLACALEGGDVVIAVRDTGIGIAAAMLPSIFDMFTQVDRSMDRHEGGLGIGLSLVKRLVEMHGGTVRARSEGPGRGSEFIVRLPIAAASLRRHAPEPRGSRGAAPKDLPSVSLRVLVVDDNQDAAESLGMMLSLVGSEVRIAHDGHEAIEAAGDFRPDAVLLDIGLPGLDGYHVAEAIRSRPWGKSMVLVAVTGWGQEKDKSASHAAGFDHHLVKPVDPDALLRLLATVEPGRDDARPGPA